MGAGSWRYALYDLRSGLLTSEHIPFKIDSYATMLSEAGTLQATLPLGDRAMSDRHLRELILPRRTALVIHRDEVPVWDGIIWTRRRRHSDRENSLAITASEIRSYFAHRHLRPELGYGSGKSLSFTGADLFGVFRTLMADAQTLVHAGDTPGDLGIDLGTGSSGVLIDRRDVGSEIGAYHGYQFAAHAQLLDDLAATDPGCEWRIDTYLDTDNVLRRRLLLATPTLGSSATDPNMITFEYPGTILDYEWPDDGETGANYVAALGAGDGDALRWAEAYNDTELDVGYPLLEAVTSHKDDSSTTILGQRATADLAQMSGDRTVPAINMVGYAEVSLGDHVRVRISDEDWWPGSSTAPMEAIVRVIGKNVTPGEKERTSLVIEEPRAPS